MAEYRGSRLYELVRERFGGATTTLANTYDIGTSAVQIARANPRRVGLLVQSLSSVRVGVGFTPNLKISDSLLLPTEGSAIAYSYEEDGESPGYAIYAVADIPGGRVHVVEVVLQ